MEDKVFDLLEKVYIDLQETKKDVKDIKQVQIETSVRLDKVDARLAKVEIKVEHDIPKKLDGLFEFRDEALKRFDRIEKKLDDISEKVDKHDIRIQVVEGGKNKRTL